MTKWWYDSKLDVVEERGDERAMSGRTLENVHAGLEPRLTACNGQFPTLALAKRITLLHAAVLPAFLGAQSTVDATRSISKAVTPVPIRRLESNRNSKPNAILVRKVIQSARLSC